MILTPTSSFASEQRRTAIVEAVESARGAVVNIHGEKTIDGDARTGDPKRRVNGMGTGVFVDPRGYIVTNFHVVDGVRKIVVTTASRETYTARLISHDPKTDLAVIKIDREEPFDVVCIGTSSDLMPGETVIAVGNAYGYEHTVTRGIISALHRTVHVSEVQQYEDLIQTDASINPGNSGGPLLNIDGEMIGINVAVRAGAQGIGFAIPVDTVMHVMADLMSVRRLEKKWHGLVVLPAGKQGLAIQSLDDASPADKAGLLVGDVITTIGETNVARVLDLERALLGRKAGDPIDVVVQRNQRPITIKLALASAVAAEPKTEGTVDLVWQDLGLKLEPAPASKFAQLRSQYRGGLTVLDVRADGPAARQGIRRGDILVGMHVWETVSLENVQFVMGREEFAQEPLKFFILRGQETLFGFISLASRTTR